MNIKTMGLQALSTTALIAFSGSAFALSCMKPDPVQQCQRMQTENLSPVWAKGQLRLKKVISQKAKEMNIGGKGPAVAEYSFTGDIRDKAGKRAVKDAKITITTSCVGPWCAKLPADKSSGAFLLKSDAQSGLKLHLGACSFQPFTVTAKESSAIEACVTPKPVVEKPAKQTGGSQIFSQRNKKKLVN
ncbi:MAG: hypothetical protein ACPG47_07105 [Leucothrix sp.]